MDIEAHIDRVGRAVEKLSAAYSAVATSGTAHTVVAKPSSRRKTAMFRLLEVCPNVCLCNGFLGGGPGQTRRLFVDLLRRERIGLVVTVCHWASAPAVADVASEAGARHLLLDRTQDAIVKWTNLRGAFDDILQTMQTQRVMINCFEYMPVGAMVAVALMVYSNTPIERAVEAVLPFEPAIRGIATAKRAVTPYQQMLVAMEDVRKTTPWTPPPPPVPEPATEPAQSRKRGRPRLDSAPTFDEPSSRRTRSGRAAAEPSPPRRLRGRLRGSDTG